MEAVVASMSPEEPKPEPDARERLFALHRELTKDALALMRKKNADYAGPGADPFKNFRRHGAYGICVRLSDKLARFETFVERGVFEVAEESIRDTAIDIVNYAILALAIVQEEKR